MIIDEGLLLTGNPIPLRGLGEVQSPKLKAVFQSIENLSGYSLVCAITACTKEKLLKLFDDFKLKKELSDMSDLDRDEASKFQLLTHSPTMREMYMGGLKLFFVGDVFYSEDYQGFVTTDNQKQPVGLIVSQNFGAVEEILLQMMHVENEGGSGQKFASDAARRLWERQNELEGNQPSGGNEDYKLSNIISKLSCGITGYTLFSIYELTVYQLYDQFYSYRQTRLAGIGDKAYSTWGGDDYDPMNWLHKKDQ